MAWNPPKTLHLYFKQSGSFRVKRWSLDVLQEECADAFPQAIQIGLLHSAHEQVGFAVNEFDDFLCQFAVVLLHGVFEGEEDVQALVLSQVLHVDAVVYVAQLLSANRVRSVHFCQLAVKTFPPLWSGCLLFIKTSTRLKFFPKRQSLWM